MPSSASLEQISFEFAADRATLENVIDRLTRSRTGGDAGIRREALARYDAVPAPARPAKNWRYDYANLDLSGFGWTTGRLPIATLPGRAPARAIDDDASPDNLSTSNAGGLFHVGAIALEPCDVPNLDSRVTVLPLSSAHDTHGALVDGVLHRIVDWRADRYAALATAFANCGAFVYVPPGVQLDEPLVLVFASAPDPAAVFPHIVVVLGEGARATVVERHVGDAEALICGTVEVRAGAGAQLDYVVAQQSSEISRVFFSRAATCDRNALVRWHLAELGSGLARTSLETRLIGEGARGDIDALFFNTGMQHVDLATLVGHQTGHTTSSTIVRSAANDRGQGRYLGNIIIAAHAHGSDASLRDDALLLSRQAHIDSIPALEIAANDVRAFHGATVGSIDEEQLFYAQSRGVARADAERMIALGFFEPAVARFPSEALRNEVRTALDGKLDEATGRQA